MTEISQELAQRMAKVIHEMDARYDGDANFDPTIDEIRKLAFLLPKPVDAVLLKARDILASLYEVGPYSSEDNRLHRQQWAIFMRDGLYDDDDNVRAVVAGIRAGIEMAARS